MRQKVRTIDGQRLTAQDFAFVPDPTDPSTWRLPIHNLKHCELSLKRIFAVNLPTTYFGPVRRRIVYRLTQLNKPSPNAPKNVLSRPPSIHH